jgi:hypothetical protein
LQAFGASEKDLERQIAPKLINFMPLGDLKALTADQGNAPLLAALAGAYGKAGKLQTTILSHRYPLASGQGNKVLSSIPAPLPSPHTDIHTNRKMK